MHNIAIDALPGTSIEVKIIFSMCVRVLLTSAFSTLVKDPKIDTIDNFYVNKVAF